MQKSLPEAATLVRTASWLAYFGIILAAWWWLYAMATGMGMNLVGQMRMPMSMDGMSMTGMSSPGVLITMWVIMMAAMMGPTFVPTIRTYEDLIGTGAGSRAGFWGVILGYLAVWFLAGAMIGLAHTVLIGWGAMSDMGVSTSTILSAGILIVAGTYQFTSAKDFCLDHCRSPMMHFLRAWRTGFAGGWRMGAGIGAFCIGCCWGIMLIGFVGGAMNLAWMGIATVIMTLEKLPDLGRWLTRPLGIVFLAAGVWQVAGPFLGGADG